MEAGQVLLTVGKLKDRRSFTSKKSGDDFNMAEIVWEGGKAEVFLTEEQMKDLPPNGSMVELRQQVKQKDKFTFGTDGQAGVDIRVLTAAAGAPRMAEGTRRAA